MHFSSGINRPPYEANDEFLQITSGCSHGSCKFCTFYKDSPFSLSPMEEIEADIKELAHSGWSFDRIYLQGADPFIRKTEDLLKIADMIYHYLPQVKSIGGYARVDNLKNKTVGEVRQLKEAGYSYFYFGVESGDDKLLDRMNKGEEILAQVEVVCQRLHISAATFQGIGACGEVEVATYIPDRQEFLPHVRNGMLEMISLMGNIVTGRQGELLQHAHALFSFFDGTTNRIDYLGGHLKKATVLYTTELVLVPVQGGKIGLKQDAATGIDVWDLEA